MNVELHEIKIPDYPSGSYNFIRRLRNEAIPKCDIHVNGASKPKPTNSSIPKSKVKLSVAIIGAGVGGLAAAIALKLNGHTVTVYEQAHALSEIGAGIQIAPNSARILHSWGLETALKRRSVKPRALTWRRWEDGTVIGRTNFNPEFEQRFGSPYYVTHRAHLHDVLHERAQELGVSVALNQKAECIDVENGIVTFEGGEAIKADLIVAADGLKSKARRILNGVKDKGPISHGLAAYRATVPMDQIRADPVTSWIAETPGATLWVGNDRHVMSYAIAGGERYNLVLTHPQRSTELRELTSYDLLADLKAHYEGWDPSLKRIVDMITRTTEWPIQEIEIPEIWSSDSGKLIITGDAAHAMTPYMALGAAMAVEDACALAASLKHLKTPADLPEAINKWVSVRKTRNRMVHDASFAHGLMLHIPDGPVQRARDEAMRPDVEGTPTSESPNQWSDPTVSQWAYSYDAEAEIHRAWEEYQDGIS